MAWVVPYCATVRPLSDTSETVVVGRQGRLVIPAGIRAAMGLEPGARLELRIDGDQVDPGAPGECGGSFRRLGASVPCGRSLVDELLAERRLAASGGMTVLDGSAVLALINNEQGSDVVAASIIDSSLGAANLAEVVGKLVDAGSRRRGLRPLLRSAARHHRAGDRSMTRDGGSTPRTRWRSPAIAGRSLLPGSGIAQRPARGADCRSGMGRPRLPDHVPAAALSCRHPGGSGAVLSSRSVVRCCRTVRRCQARPAAPV